MDDKKLENEETWDLANAQPQPPIKNRRSVVSVAYRPEQLAEVAHRARAAGMKVSEYIRNRSLDHANEAVGVTSVMITAGGLEAVTTFQVEELPPVTGKATPERDQEIDITANAEVRELAG